MDIYVREFLKESLAEMEAKADYFSKQRALIQYAMGEIAMNWIYGYWEGKHCWKCDLGAYMFYAERLVGRFSITLDGKEIDRVDRPEQFTHAVINYFSKTRRPMLWEYRQIRDISNDLIDQWHATFGKYSFVIEKFRDKYILYCNRCAIATLNDMKDAHPTIRKWLAERIFKAGEEISRLEAIKADCHDAAIAVRQAELDADRAGNAPIGSV